MRTGDADTTTTAGGNAYNHGGTCNNLGGNPCSETSAASGDPIVIGLSKGLTGFWVAFDGPGLLGAQIAVDEINAAGGVGGRPLELEVCDAKSDVNQAAACGLQLVESGVDMMLTTCDYDFGGPAAREANKAKMISIGCAGATNFGVEGIGPYHYNDYAGNPGEAATIVEYGYNELGFRKPYLLADLTIEYSKNLCELVEEHWNTVAGEGTIAGKDTFLNDDPSIAVQLSKVKSSGADSIILCSFIPGGSSALRQIRGDGIDLPIFGTSSFDGDYWIEAIPDLSNFISPVPLSEWGDPTNNPLVDKVIETHWRTAASIHVPAARLQRHLHPQGGHRAGRRSDRRRLDEGRPRYLGG